MLKLTNITKVVNKGTVNEKTIYKDLSLEINSGDFITIIGSNGAGKSTLLNIISGLTNHDNGNIFLENKSIGSLPEFKRTKKIGRVFQNPELGTIPSMTILENMSMAFNKNNPFGFSFGLRSDKIEFFKELLKTLDLGLENSLNTKVSLLSGGQRQALTLLMVSLCEPKLLLLDEHTAALDPKTSEIIMKLTDKIVSKNNTTTLMVTHNLSHAINYGNRIIMFHNGEIILDLSGNEKKLLTKEKILQIFNSEENNKMLNDEIVLN